MFLYRLARNIVKIVLYPLLRVQVHGKEHIPKDGPVIICSNHISNFDPPVVAITSPRNVHFMAKAELFEKKFLGKFLLAIQSFPVKRGMKDRNALRMGLDVLEKGHVLGLFPEGTRSKTGKMGEPLAGAGFFALRSKATIVPCAIIGPYKIGKKLNVIYGKPVDMDVARENKLSAKEAVTKVMDEIQTLISEFDAQK
ncbi:lysophospholipid acyltransferase family protein [Lentibacillus saliphilus]|uniref:lysophospholipid acyltransferase family protein n=1 Tax=Lentibacillus saliphilus TaxID=2737028 RepID=UPI001C2F78C5|nr:lysophospholipid acyltransferase family protein [Lentibacillus saliphilus]